MSCPCSNVNSNSGSALSTGPDSYRGIPISRQLLRDNDLLTKLKFAYYINPIKFKSYFSEIGIEIDNPEEQLPVLAELSKKGLDQQGRVKRPISGEPIKFSVNDVFNKVIVSTCDLNKDKIVLI